MLISVGRAGSSANQIAAALRRRDPPIIVRIVDDQVVIDLRTVALEEVAELERALSSLGN